MEGPSIFLAVKQLSPFIGKKVLSVGGNTKTTKEQLVGEKIISIFSFGKQLFFQCEKFALRVHFLLYGTFEATVKGKRVTGDYPKKSSPRLSLLFLIGSVDMYNCSVKFIDHPDAKKLFDFSVDTLSDNFDDKQALQKMRARPSAQIGDVLLDQNIFAGVGNIIKNEVLHRAKVLPTTKINKIPLRKMKEIIDIILIYVLQFYEWRKHFQLKKNYIVYRQRYCRDCGEKIKKTRTGELNRISFTCSKCQIY